MRRRRGRRSRVTSGERPARRREQFPDSPDIRRSGRSPEPGCRAASGGDLSVRTDPSPRSRGLMERRPVRGRLYHRIPAAPSTTLAPTKAGPSSSTRPDNAAVTSHHPTRARRHVQAQFGNARLPECSRRIGRHRGLDRAGRSCPLRWGEELSGGGEGQVPGVPVEEPAALAWFVQGVHVPAVEHGDSPGAQVA
jgi:hypothetical protein